MRSADAFRPRKRPNILHALSAWLCAGFIGLTATNAAAQVVATPPAPLNTNAAGDLGSDTFARFATDGAGTWIAVWSTTDQLGVTNGTDADIAVARSLDDGLTWSAPVALNANAGIDSGPDVDPVIATDGAGTWVVAWDSQENLAGVMGTDSDIFYARSLDNGGTWGAVAPLNTNAAGDTEGDFVPTIASVGAGQWITAWESNENVGGDIESDTDLLIARSIDNGGSWGDPTPLNTNAATDTGNDISVDLLSDGGSNWVAVWASDHNLGGLAGTDLDIFVARSSDFANNWTGPQALNINAATDSGNDFNPSLATDESGNWLAVWDSFENIGGDIKNDRDILSARSTNNGAAWTIPQALNANAIFDTGQDALPRAAVDGKGNWIAVWESTDDLGGLVGTDRDIFVARSTDAGQSWAFPQTMNINSIIDSGDDAFPQVAFAADDFVVIWHSNDDLGATIKIDNDILFALGDFVIPRRGASGATGGCFIATAAYGTPAGQRLDTLRAFRDRYLLESSLGTAFADAYYRLSPPLAERVAESPVLAAAIRALLAPLVVALALFMAHPIAVALVLAGAAGAAIQLRRNRAALLRVRPNNNGLTN